MSKPIVVLDEKGNPPATPRSNLEKDLLGSITPGASDNDSVQQMANFFSSDIKISSNPQRPTVVTPNMMVRTNPPPPNTTPKPITPNVPPSLPTKVMTSANPPVRILPGNATGISPSFKFAAPITGTVPTAPTGPTMITPGTTTITLGTPGANTVITTLPNAPPADPQQRLAAFKQFLEKQKALMGPTEGQQWVDIVNQYFAQKIDIRKMLDSLQVLVGKEKRDMIVNQATKEGHLTVPKPPQPPAQPMLPFQIPTDKTVLNLLQPQQRDKILEQLKDYPEHQKYQIIARILEGNIRKKQQATTPAPTQIKPPTLPNQMSELEKKKLTTPAKPGDSAAAAKQALPEDVVEDLKDVTRVAGVDLDKESEEILQDPDQTERWDEDRNPTVARTDLLKRRIIEIANKNGLKTVTDEAVLYFAYAIEAQMKDIIGVANRGIPLTKFEMFGKKYTRNLLKNSSRKLKFIEKAEQEEMKRLKRRKTDDKHENMNRAGSVTTNALMSMAKNPSTAATTTTTGPVAPTTAPPTAPERIVERTIVHDSPPPKKSSSSSTILSFDD